MAGPAGSESLASATTAHRPLLLKPGEGGVEGAERDVGREAELVAQQLADLVAVAVLLAQQAEDGEIEHVPNIAVRYIDDATLTHLPGSGYPERPVAARPSGAPLSRVDSTRARRRLAGVRVPRQVAR